MHFQTSAAATVTCVLLAGLSCKTSELPNSLSSFQLVPLRFFRSRQEWNTLQDHRKSSQGTTRTPKQAQLFCTWNGATVHAKAASFNFVPQLLILLGDIHKPVNQNLCLNHCILYINECLEYFEEIYQDNVLENIKIDRTG